MGLQPELQSAAVAARRLSDVLVLEAEQIGGDTQARLERIDAPIKLQDVDFRYGTRRKVLEQVSLTIPPGGVVGMVGESGSGKTTIAKLLMKFYSPESGKIEFGDLASDDISAESLRDRIAYVAQDTAFFSGTIEENLRLAAPLASPQQLIAACQVAQAHEFIAAMPARYQSHLEEDAANLSGGQRQRLAIARALLRGSDMLILDEATSNMDSISERAVSETIQSLGRGITRLVIAHRLSTVVACDVIYVMKAGRVVESGTHAELLAAGGEYAQLWQAQTTGENRPRTMTDVPPPVAVIRRPVRSGVRTAPDSSRQPVGPGGGRPSAVPHEKLSRTDGAAANQLLRPSAPNRLASGQSPEAEGRLNRLEVA